MLSVAEALDRVLAEVPVLSAETLPLSLALGRVLAEPVVAEREIPPWDNSAMDGYAVRAADLRDAGPAGPVALTVVGEVVAGAIARGGIGPGQAYRILTGAPLPSGSDAVVPQEEVERDGDRSCSHARRAGRRTCVRGARTSARATACSSRGRSSGRRRWASWPRWATRGCACTNALESRSSPRGMSWWARTPHSGPVRSRTRTRTRWRPRHGGRRRAAVARDRAAIAARCWWSGSARASRPTSSCPRPACPSATGTSSARRSSRWGLAWTSGRSTCAPESR